MNWFRIKLIETEMPVAVPEGQPTPMPARIRVPSSVGKVHYPTGSYRIFVRGKDPAAVDAVIGVGNPVGATPADWQVLTIDEAKEAIREILGRDPLPGQVP